jgi:ribosomal protein S18 acetylase RimI-like enzyme
MNPGSANLSIREMTESELPLLQELWEAAELEYRPLGRDSVEHLTSEWQANRGGFIGAFDGDRLAGSVLATDDGRRGWVNRVAVRPEYRRMGLGAALIRAAETELRGRKLQIIAALIEEDNTPSRRLFEQEAYTTMPSILYYSKRDSWDV